MEEKRLTAEDLAADESFIAYYLKSNIEAVSYWQHWISMHPDQIDEVQNAEHLLDLLHFRLPQHELANERSRLSAFISTHHDLPVPEVHTLSKPSFKLFKYLKIAAVLVIISALGLKFLPALRSGHQQNTVISWSTYTSPKTQKSLIRLSDGTEVTLNAGSTLQYPKAFLEKERLVKLTGQAFFDVSHDAAHPFIVSSGKVSTRVLGTAFNVSAGAADPDVSVALIKGSVRIDVTGQSKQFMLLKPGERIRYNKLSGQLQKGTFDEETEAGWRTGLIVLKGADFNTIADVFRRNYGYTLVNHSSTQKIDYTGKFNNQAPTQIIQSICFSLGLSFKVQNDTIILSNN